LADAKKALALAGPAKSGGEDGTKTIAGIKTVLRLVDGVGTKDLKSLADGAKSQIGSGVVAFVSTADGKASIVVGVTEDIAARISAVDLVRVAAEALGGKGGGGRPDMAQAGGPDAGKAADALAAIEKRLSELAPV
jgi:alanyl-tRNA synthetase